MLLQSVARACCSGQAWCDGSSLLHSPTLLFGLMHVLVHVHVVDWHPTDKLLLGAVRTHGVRACCTHMCCIAAGACGAQV
jgi:hypothetical protein